MWYYVGTSGWHYPHWRNRFYPEKLSKSKWLEYYTGHFTTVELNNSFYRLPSEGAFNNWRNSSPFGFTFAVKVSRYITHIKKLRDTEEAVERFVSRAKILGEKLGPLLYQLPPNMQRDDDRLGAFLSTLPRGVKHVVEFRHQSWLEERVLNILRKYEVGLCVFNMPLVVCPLLATTDFAYIRFHGSSRLYCGSYSDDELADWGEKLTTLGANMKGMYIYFNNDAEAFAIRNAMTLRGYLQSNVRSGDVVR